MLHLVAGRAQGYESFKRLDMLLVVIGEDLVALNRPFLPSAAANLTLVSGADEGDLLQTLPLILRDVGADILVPRCLRH